MDRREQQILAWIQENDSEDIEEEVFRADIIESNGESEHSDHHTDTEQSSTEDDEGERYPIQPG